MSEPEYYSKNGLSPLRAFEEGLLSEEEYIGFLKGNVIKYTIRAGEKTKDPLLDIIKAMDYLRYLHQVLKRKADKDEPVSVIKQEGKNLPKGLINLKKDIEDFKREYGLE